MELGIHPPTHAIQTGLLTPPRSLLRALKQVRRAMELGIHAPKLTLEGFGGTYFLYDPRRRPLAVFKPADEEPYGRSLTHPPTHPPTLPS